jgi:hypothetical protein
MTTSIFKLVIKLITLIFILLQSVTMDAQSWERIDGLSENEFSVVKVISGNIFTIAGNELFKSSDGENWETETITIDFIIPTTFTIHNNTMFVGTISSGVFYKEIGSAAPWQQKLNGTVVSSFEVFNSELYLSTYGNGVFKNVNNNWENININLPNYSYNVSKISVIDNTLYAFAGGNGTYRIIPLIEHYNGGQNITFLEVLPLVLPPRIFYMKITSYM